MCTQADPSRQLEGAEPARDLWINWVECRFGFSIEKDALLKKDPSHHGLRPFDSDSDPTQGLIILKLKSKNGGDPGPQLFKVLGSDS